VRISRRARRRCRRRSPHAAERLRLRGDGGGSTDASGKVEGDITFQNLELRANFKSYFEGVIAGFEKKYPAHPM